MDGNVVKEAMVPFAETIQYPAIAAKEVAAFEVSNRKRLLDINADIAEKTGKIKCIGDKIKILKDNGCHEEAQLLVQQLVNL